ncbi:endolytic transglycosylase MltG [Streptomyces sp. IB2014 016-6]|uniref:endolytic transglycosylase MltG n=1 Tax=Streptomyces sp. IB2014 016-6 TaxID=2517818 RepID=UPI0011C999F1|nr:endolytic transglycosylase MltG [Streptomyces sp. IB2014 016-6]TXL88452.1 endolytic transglycosylase MltG [Streptomyces sp. IB2014 016-6]
MKNEPPHATPERRPRLTRRGRLVLIVSAAVVVATAVLVPLLLVPSGEPPAEEKKTVSLLVPEGRRATQVYASVDKVLDIEPGTTEKAATATRLELPDAARRNPEGYLFPATYPVEAGATPAGLLGYMVDTARERFGAERVTSGARRNGVSVYQSVTIASIVQAEADTPTDMGRVARVVHNRLAKDMPLQMDSTLNYALNRSTLDTTHSETKTASPYNTYEFRGLPPTPIGNPGEEAMNAAINPARGDWLYFVTVAPGDTRFTADYTEHQRNVAEFNANRSAATH